MRSFMFDILQGDMTRSKVILTFTCLKMYIARSGDTSGSRTTLFLKCFYSYFFLCMVIYFRLFHFFSLGIESVFNIQFVI